MAGQKNGGGGWDEESLGRSGPRPGEIILPPRPGYPLSGCFPAEPDSVSPGKGQSTKIAWRMKQYPAACSPVMDGVPKHRPAGDADSRATENYPQSRRAAQVVRLPGDTLGRGARPRRRSRFQSHRGPTAARSARAVARRPPATTGCRSGDSSSCRCGSSRSTSCMPCGGSIVRGAA